MDENEKNRILDLYYANNASKLRGMVNQIISRFGGITDPDHYYSLANEVFTDVLKRFNGEDSFDVFLYSCLSNKIKTEQTRQNRIKRTSDRESISTNISIGDDNNSTLEDILPSDFDIEESLFKEDLSDNTKIYLSQLSDKQREVADLIMDGYNASDIRHILKLSYREYDRIFSGMTSYEAKRILLKDVPDDTDTKDDKKGERNNMVMATTLEKSKNTSYSIEAISKKLRKHTLRDDHVLQRPSGQWTNLYKGELICDILRDKPLLQIIISEENTPDGIQRRWIIDGKQRCTVTDDYLHDGFAIAKNVHIYNIEYQTTLKDENGDDVLNEEGFPIPVMETFDVRGKKFSQLPEELQDKYKEYQIPVLLNISCTKRDIAEDIARFNRCKPMNTAQNGWLGMDEDFAELIDNILKTEFFKEDCEITSFKGSSNRTGMLRRMAVESIMVSHYIEHFDKSFDKMCKFLSEEGNDAVFADFYDMVERLNNTLTKETANLFNIKNSFLWFGLFSRFSDLGIEDSRFSDFLIEFSKTLHNTPDSEGHTFDELNGGSTKDRNVVIKELNYLESLMRDYLHISENNEAADGNYDDICSFVANTTGIDYDTVQTNVDLYLDSLDSLLDNTIKDGSKLLDVENQPSLLAMVAYSYSNDIDLDDWMKAYASKNNSYIPNQYKNYMKMVADLEKYNSEILKTA